MAPRNTSTKNAENLDTGSEVFVEPMSLLPPPSPSGYEHCFLTRLNPDDNSKSAQFDIQTTYYLPTGPGTLQMDASVISALNQSQRDVLRYILEDRNGRTSDSGRWVLAGLQGVGATSDEERSESFEICIMFCEYEVLVHRRFDQFCPAMTSDVIGDDASAPDSELQESEKNWFEQKIACARGNKVTGRKNANMSQGLNTASPVPDKDDSLAFSENSNMRGTALLKTKDEGRGTKHAPAQDSGRGTKPSATLRFSTTQLGENYDGGKAPNPGTFSLRDAHQTSSETPVTAATSPSLATIQAAAAQWEPYSAISELHATPSLPLSDSKKQQPSNERDQTQKEGLPTLTSRQLSDMHMFACELRREGDFQRAILLFRILWYCRETLIGPYDCGTLNTLHQLAATYNASGQTEMATSLQVVLIIRSSDNPANVLTEPAPAPIVSEISETQRWAIELRRRRDFDRAISMLTIVWYVWDILGGEWHGSARTVLNELAVTYEAGGKQNMAKKLRDKLAKRR